MGVCSKEGCERIGAGKCGEEDVVVQEEVGWKLWGGRVGGFDDGSDGSL